MPPRALIVLSLAGALLAGTLLLASEVGAAAPTTTAPAPTTTATATAPTTTPTTTPPPSTTAPVRAAGAASRAFGIQILAPGQPARGTATLSAPQDAVQFGGAFAYPADGSIAAAGSVTLSVSADSGTAATASAAAEVTGLKLLGGEITADSVSSRATSTATPSAANGDLSASAVANLVVLGQPVTPSPNLRVQLADWGYAIVLEQSVAAPVSGPPSYDGFVIALDVHLTADHGGLAAGSEIQIGLAKATTQAPVAPPVPTAPTTTRSESPKAKRRAPEPKPSNGIPAPVKPPPSVTPKLTAGGYVFPVYGSSSFIDTFGGARSDVSGGWHHGDDIFAALGTPLLACASGTVFSVGPNPVGGNRLWIRDDAGNEFYYAHLSAYSPLAKNGAHVNAGDVIGFVGNTGDARGTPFHLHFEIHPVGMLGLGYDGAVDPTSYLAAWRRLTDLPISAAGAYATAPAPGAQAPKPGAILLQVSDISTASGLDPDSLRRAMAPISAEGDGALLRLAGASAPARADAGADR